MWHEARKQEKKVRGMIVDYKRRAERRREFYEKIRRDPAQFLQIHGSSAKIHMDSSISTAAESCLMPWRGDDKNMIDRFDVRAHLDTIGNEEISSTSKHEKSEIEKDSASERLINYERWRTLIQNEFLTIPESKALHQIWLEERFGMNQPSMIDSPTQQNVNLKKKLAEKKAKIGYNYDKPEDNKNLPIKSVNESSSSEEDSDSDEEFDTTINIETLTGEQTTRLNSIGTKFGLGSDDFVIYAEEDLAEAERIRIAKELENEKSMFSGRKSRRERRALKERRMLILRANNPEESMKPIATLMPNNSIETKSGSTSPSSESEVDEAKIEFITSFGGSSDEGQNEVASMKRDGKGKSNKKKEHKNSSLNAAKKVPLIEFGPSLPPEIEQKMKVKPKIPEISPSRDFTPPPRRSPSVRRSLSRSPDFASRKSDFRRNFSINRSMSRSPSTKRYMDRIRDRSRNRKRSRSKSRSRSRSRICTKIRSYRTRSRERRSYRKKSSSKSRSRSQSRSRSRSFSRTRQGFRSHRRFRRGRGSRSFSRSISRSPRRNFRKRDRSRNRGRSRSRSRDRRLKDKSYRRKSPSPSHRRRRRKSSSINRSRSRSRSQPRKRSRSRSPNRRNSNRVKEIKKSPQKDSLSLEKKKQSTENSPKVEPDQLPSKQKSPEPTKSISDLGQILPLDIPMPTVTPDPKISDSKQTDTNSSDGPTTLQEMDISPTISPSTNQEAKDDSSSIQCGPNDDKSEASSSLVRPNVPLKRYYRHDLVDESSGPELDEEVEEEPSSTEKLSPKAANSLNIRNSKAGNSIKSLTDKMKKKTQALIERQYKLDKAAEREKREKHGSDRRERDSRRHRSRRRSRSRSYLRSSSRSGKHRSRRRSSSSRSSSSSRRGFTRSFSRSRSSTSSSSSY